MDIIPFYRHLTDDGLIGDGTNHIATVDGSSTAVPFWAGPTEKFWGIYRMLVTIKDNGVIAADKYGAATMLTNGITVKILSGDPSTGPVRLDLLDGVAIKSNTDWASHCFDAVPHVFGSGDNFVMVRWTFANAGRPLVLDANFGDKLVVTVRDNLTVLTAHSFQIHGHSFESIGEHVVTW